MSVQRDRGPQGKETIADQIYRVPHAFELKLPKGKYIISLAGLLPPKGDKEVALLLNLPPTSVTVEEDVETALGLEPSPMERVSDADLLSHPGKLGRVQGVFTKPLAMPWSTPVSDSAKKAVWSGWAVKSYEYVFSGTSMVFVEPRFASPKQEPNLFLEYDVLAVCCTDLAPRPGITLYIYALVPTGLIALSPEMEALIQKGWDEKSPLESGKNAYLTAMYNEALRQTSSKNPALPRAQKEK